MGSVDVVADYAAMVTQAKAHMTNIPPCNTPWPEAPHEYERVGTLRACDEAVRGWHYTVKGGSTCILCGLALGLSPVRMPVTFASIPAPTPPARAAVAVDAGGWDANGSPVCEEPWSL